MCASFLVSVPVNVLDRKLWRSCEDSAREIVCVGARAVASVESWVILDMCQSRTLGKCDFFIYVKRVVKRGIGDEERNKSGCHRHAHWNQE